MSVIIDQAQRRRFINSVRLLLYQYRRVIIIGAIVIITVIAQEFLVSRVSQPELTMFDVGQGDSLLLRFPSQETVLIDGGPDRTVVSAIAKKIGYFRHSIDLVILTHPHADHLNGLVEVLKRYDVGHVLTTGIAGDGGPEWNAWQAWTRAHADRVWYAKRSDEYTVGSGTIKVLYPPQPLLGSSPPHQGSEGQGGLNDASIVFMLTLNKKKWLFMGDASEVIESQLMRLGEDLHAQVLKVGHHGSRFSTSEQFLRLVKPEVALISVGANSFGHPAQSVIYRLEHAGAHVYRTDKNGTTIITSQPDGSLTTSTQRTGSP